MLGASVFTLGLFHRVTHYYYYCVKREKQMVFHNSQNNCATVECLAVIYLANILRGDMMRDIKNTHFIRFHSSTFINVAPLLKLKAMNDVLSSRKPKIFAQYLVAKSVCWEIFLWVNPIHSILFFLLFIISTKPKRKISQKLRALACFA